jgi:hypothetical protein
MPPPEALQGKLPLALLKVHAGVEAAVVVIVSVAVPEAAPVIDTGLVALKLKVGGLTLPEGLDVRLAERLTLPVNPLAGETVTVDEFPVVAPAVTVTAVEASVNVGGETAVSPMVEDVLPW